MVNINLTQKQINKLSREIWKLGQNDFNSKKFKSNSEMDKEERIEEMLKKYPTIEILFNKLESEVTE